ncbi:MAG: hypothetical protein IT292_06655 [Deltaproteobacteria bacterium]|nr:hypothetical protein [Deltaproteobacteria bacterium]
MGKTYRISVYGKKGCDKCKVLNERLDGLLSNEQWQDFEKSYRDVETEDGLVSFVKAEALNPQRIPSFFIEKVNNRGEYEPIINPDIQTSDSLSRPWRYIGLETDYSEKGRGIITPQMITDVLGKAKGL